MRRVLGATLVLVALALALPFLGSGGPDGSQEASGPGQDIVTVTERDSLWPHTSRSQSSAGRTLAINVLVEDDAGAVTDTLTGLDDPDWRPTNESIEEANVTLDAGDERVELVWHAAHGGTRYTYVERDGRGRWLDERTQLHTGTYLATRDHVRLYAPTDTSGWSALQVHREYWDWFRLRHTVTDVVDSRQRLQRDLRARSYRTADRLPGADGRGRMVVLERAGLLAVALAVPLARRNLGGPVNRMGDVLSGRSSYRLAAFVLVVPLAVRVAGVAGELAIASHSPKLIAAPLYLVLVGGLPLGVRPLATDATPLRAFTVTVASFLLAVAVDFAAMGVVVPPTSVVLDRVTLAVGLGTVAAGSAIDGPARRRILAAGAAIWLWGVIASLGLGFT